MGTAEPSHHHAATITAAVKVNRLTGFCIAGPVANTGITSSQHAGSADTLRHFNQEHGGCWTKATGLAISATSKFLWRSRKSDPFGVLDNARVDRTTTNDPNSSGLAM